MKAHAALCLLGIVFGWSARGAAPVITDPMHPADTVIANGFSGGLRIFASAPAGTTVRWWKDGAPLVGAPAGSPLLLTSVTPGVAGLYHVVLSHPEGSVTSRVARVTVPPSVTLRRVGGLESPGSVLALKCVTNRLYVGVSDVSAPVAGLEIYDLAQPEKPVLLGAYRAPRLTSRMLVRDVVIDGSRAFLAMSDSGIRVVDVSDPVAPVEVGAYPSDRSPIALAVEGTRLYVGTLSGMEILDVANPGAMVRLGSYTLSSGMGSVVVRNGLAYLAGNAPQVAVLDVADPARPRRVGVIAHGDPVHTVRVVGNRAYVSGGVPPHVFDVTDPGAPVKLGGVISPVDSRGMGVVEELVLDGGVPMPGRPQQLNLFDAGSLPAVFPAGGIPVAGPVEAVDWAHGLAYVAVTRGGVDIVELVENGPPVVVEPLAPVTAVVGSAVEFRARISGGVLWFQWHRDGQPLAGQTNRVLRIPSVSVADVGTYSVTASNRLGSVSGGDAALVLGEAPRLGMSGFVPRVGSAPRPLLTGAAGFQGRIHVSGNLLEWRPIWMGQLTTEPPDVWDDAGSGQGWRFYRFEPGL